MFKKKNHDHRIDGIKSIQKTYDLVPGHLAIIIDNEVVEVMHCSERLEAILLSNPSFVKISSEIESVPEIGFLYDNGVFKKPRVEDLQDLYKSNPEIFDIDVISIQDENGENAEMKIFSKKKNFNLEVKNND